MFRSQVVARANNVIHKHTYQLRLSTFWTHYCTCISHYYVHDLLWIWKLWNWNWLPIFNGKRSLDRSFNGLWVLSKRLFINRWVRIKWKSVDCVSTALSSAKFSTTTTTQQKKIFDFCTPLSAHTIHHPLKSDRRAYLPQTVKWKRMRA